MEINPSFCQNFILFHLLEAPPAPSVAPQQKNPPGCSQTGWGAGNWDHSIPHCSYIAALQSWGCQGSRYSQKDSSLQPLRSSHSSLFSPSPRKREEKANSWSKSDPKTLPKAQDHFPKDSPGSSSGGFGPEQLLWKEFFLPRDVQAPSCSSRILWRQISAILFLLRIHCRSPSTIL